jgi:hypothetical protein
MLLSAAASRKFCFRAACVALLGASLAFVSQARAQTYTVTNDNDSGAGSLRQAITSADAYSAANPGAATTITFTVGGTITLASELPVITSNVTINGNGFNPTVSGNNTYRPFFVGDAGQNPTTSVSDSNTYAVTIQNLTVTGGKAQGGSGIDGGGGGAGLGGGVRVEQRSADAEQRQLDGERRRRRGWGGLHERN